PRGPRAAHPFLAVGRGWAATSPRWPWSDAIDVVGQARGRRSLRHRRHTVGVRYLTVIQAVGRYVRHVLIAAPRRKD
ncbi:MAG: hypothetical protein M3Z46_10300, partial [Actinomycetota bacterium]|nr:hypothetical protein [Actinomycetota bacterium]